MKEGSTGLITLEASTDVTEGDDPYAVSLMINFLYESDYQPQLLQTTSLVGEQGEQGDHEDLRLGVEAHVSKSTYDETPVDDNKEEMWISSKKGKKAKKKSAAFRMKDPSAEEETPPEPPTASAKSFVAVHAKVFALGSKYEIPHLQRRSLANFKAATRLWSRDGLIESIPIAFTTALDNNSLRITIKAIVTANSALLIDDPAFQDVINGIEGLAFELFRQQTHYRGGQRTCLGCRAVYRSRCAAQGCLSHWGEMHTCDKGDICMNCRNNE